MESIIIKSSFLSISPQKLNLVAELIRRRNLEYSLNLLSFVPKKGSRIIGKILFGIKKSLEKQNETLRYFYLRKVEVNRSMIQKRVIYRAKGRTDRIRKRYSTVNIHLEKRNNLLSESKNK
jgi:large subunit ribosomal protein L22